MKVNLLFCWAISGIGSRLGPTGGLFIERRAKTHWQPDNAR
jgi:hypothetical protein